MNIATIEILLLVAAVVAMAVRRLRLPYTVGLVVAGAVLALSRAAPEIPLTKDLIFQLFLPPLVFEAALYIRWHELRRDLPVIVTLASAGVVLSATITAAGMHFLVQWEWPSAIVFGCLIAATDPVSVIASFREAGVRGRLALLVEAESLFNDSTAAIAFVVALALATGAPLSMGGIAWSLALSVGGGVGAGLLITAPLLALAGRTTDHLVELTLTTVAAYGSFLAAEHFGASGVLASMTAGLLVGNVGIKGPISEAGRQALESFWEYAAFVVNSLVFLLIGFREAQQNLASVWMAAAVATVFVVLGRAVAVYPLCAIFNNSRHRISAAHQHVLFWAGLRGALALALALGLPATLPRHDEITTVAFAVVAFSIIVQGLTMTPLLRRLGQIPGAAAPRASPEA